MAVSCETIEKKSISLKKSGQIQTGQFSSSKDSAEQTDWGRRFQKHLGNHLVTKTKASTFIDDLDSYRKNGNK